MSKMDALRDAVKGMIGSGKLSTGKPSKTKVKASKKPMANVAKC